MSYDLYLVRPTGGKAAQSMVEELTESDPTAHAAPVDPAAENLKAEVAAAVVGLIPTMEPFKSEYDKVAEALSCTQEEARLRFRHVELTDVRQGHEAQITIFDRHVFVTVPFSHGGPAADAVLGDIAAVGRMLAKRWGFVTYDPQLD